MHDGKAVSLAILMTDAFGSPSTDGIDDVGRAFDGTEAIAQAVSERVDDTSIRHPRLQPLVQGAANIDGLITFMRAVAREEQPPVM